MKSVKPIKCDHLTSQRLCTNCSQYYKEANNFNWSCKTHTSPWQGEMYWCCGRNKKNAPGCKTQKHTWLNEEEE
jgi:hypothetical protein